MADLGRDAWGGGWWVIRGDDADGDGWREYNGAVPVITTTLELLAEHGPLGPVWWRYGRQGRHTLLDALERARTPAPPTTSGRRPGRRRPTRSTRS
ncbi:hypothetical protein [Kitasatospora sp. McL0602]|uniref:hypothetical protein n=1 Tax=Kitasatospora sp. McL0602 TaxID=3439530 RepID=UPI003F8878A4